MEDKIRYFRCWVCGRKGFCQILSKQDREGYRESTRND